MEDAGRERFVEVVLDALEHQLEDAEPRGVSLREAAGNDVAEVRFADGRTLMVKRADRPEMGPRFETSRVAADLLRKRAGVVAPRHLEMPLRVDEHPVEAYWRIPYPTLRRLWPELESAERKAALRDWGGLLRRVHEVRLEGHGPLPAAVDGGATLAEFLAADLGGRLCPAIDGAWPDGRSAAGRLADAATAVAGRLEHRPSVLVHNDLWMGNVLCDVDDEDGAVRCVGVLDLEDAFAGPAEAELAKTAILHGPLFGHALEGPWFDRVWEGYGEPADPLGLAFFRAYHLLNMGYNAAISGYDDHARDVARAAEAELETLDYALRAPRADRL